MLQGFNQDRTSISDYHQRVADRNIQSLDDRQEEIEQAKNGFIGMLAGILVGAIVGWVFLAPKDKSNKEVVIPVIHRQPKPFKVQPNDPGGMEIDNQDREIYHIVDNTQKEIKEVNIRPLPDMPKMVVENTISIPNDMESLVESINEDVSLKDEKEEDFEEKIEEVKLAETNLLSINTNSREKIVIPQKIKDVEVNLQDTINSNVVKKTENISDSKPQEKIAAPIKNLKGTWYAQIIASSSRSAVEKLWKGLLQKNTFLKQYHHEIEEITATNGSTLYRLKVGAFKTRTEADNLAYKLKQNKISCIIKQN
ncbi:MAG: SPOR domain-containing protein [Alphaproteobacteria bacterium]|nr:SPOR domain-containing protein [Alphaproteobacteria bacterium]